MVAQFNFPTTMLYGPGAVDELGERLAGQTAPLLLVTDPGLVAAGLAGSVQASLERAGLTVVVHDRVQGNPVEADVTSGVERYREAGAGGLVALGGGSPMDVAKAIAVLINHDGPLSRFDDAAGGDRFIDKPLPPVYAVPTTAGTGSEVGRSGVIVCADTGVKTVIFHPGLMPKIAVLDPALTAGLPAHLTAATGMDALTHGLEAYLARGFHPMADAIALGCVELVIANLPRVIDHPDDLDARGRMQIAAAMGATAFQKGLGVVHSMAHPMSTRYGTHHGLANALLLPRALRWQLDAKTGAFTTDLRARYARLAALFGADSLPDAIDELCRRVGIEQTPADAGLTADDVDALADEAFNDPCHNGNPIPLSRDDLAAAFRACL